MGTSQKNETLIRRERNRLLAETDWVVIKARENGGQVSSAWRTYRVALRNIPSDQSDATKYSEITWTQPNHHNRNQWQFVE